jgi:hypothetical protein
MTSDLRIPVTAAQKEQVAEAMAINGQEFAGWARNLILTNVQALLDQKKRKRLPK